jgi:hypothetical protein
MRHWEAIVLHPKRQYKFHRLAIAVVYFCFPMSAQAAVLLQTTFNCPDWNQTMGVGESDVCAVGDGIRGWGGWVTAGHPNGDEINAAANNPAGAGGKGFRHWRGDGFDNNAGGIRLAFSAVPEFWIRWYMRYESGFNWNPVGHPDFTKDIYFTGNTASDVKFGYQFGSYGVSVVSPVVNLLGGSWSGVMGGNTGDGAWHCYEAHLKMDTNNADGIAESWIDGNLIQSATSVNYTNGTWNDFILGSNQNEPSNGQDMYTDYDDIALSDTGRVGCLSSPSSSACDVNGDSATNVSDVQQCVNQAIGSAACSTGDINKDGSCTVVDVQRVVNSALGGACVSP